MCNDGILLGVLTGAAAHRYHVQLRAAVYIANGIHSSLRIYFNLWAHGKKVEVASSEQLEDQTCAGKYQTFRERRLLPVRPVIMLMFVAYAVEYLLIGDRWFKVVGLRLSHS